MPNTFYLKKGDTYPNISTQLSDETGPVDLTGCTVRFRMSEPGTTNLMIDELATVLGQGSPENLGKCYYSWVEGDTDIVGTYRAEWRVTFPSGKKATFPRGVTVIGTTTSPIYNQVIIQPDVD